MSQYSFPGYTVFVEAAAREFGLPDAEKPARRVAALAALANLCGQIEAGEPERAREVLDKAGEFRDQLRVAHRAAEMILEEVRAAHGLAPAVSPERRPANAGGRVARKS